MTIEQTVEIPSDYHVFLELPRSVPVGTKARIQIDIPTVPVASGADKTPDGTARVFRGILKGRGITLERFREMQREDKALEDAADDHHELEAVERQEPGKLFWFR